MNFVMFSTPVSAFLKSGHYLKTNAQTVMYIGYNGNKMAFFLNRLFNAVIL